MYLRIICFLLNIVGFYCVKLPENILLHLNRNESQKVDIGPYIWPKISLTLNENLTFSFGVFRHGNRAPRFTYPGNPYVDPHYWPNGKNQLTEKGKMQMYSLGQKLRERYQNFLPEKYNKNDIIMKCNPVDRVYISGLSLLGGLYPATPGYDLPWQPIPVWEEKYDVSKVSQSRTICPKLYQEMYETALAVNKFTYQYKDILNKFNIAKLNFTQISDIYVYWDIISMTEMEYGYVNPEWSDQIFRKNLENLDATVFQAFSASSLSLQRHLTGPLAKRIYELITNKINGNTLKVYLEGGHETTLNALFPVLGIKEPVIVLPSSIILIELITPSESAPYVQILYFDHGEVDNPRILEIPSCGSKCNVNDFLKIISKSIPDDWEKECQL